MTLPHTYFKTLISGLPEAGEYGSGLVFLPQNQKDRDLCIETFSRCVENEGLKILAWRDVPVDSSVIGEIAKASEPLMKQVFVAGKAALLQDELERKLYIARKCQKET